MTGQQCAERAGHDGAHTARFKLGCPTEAWWPDRPSAEDEEARAHAADLAGERDAFLAEVAAPPPDAVASSAFLGVLSATWRRAVARAFTDPARRRWGEDIADELDAFVSEARAVEQEGGQP